MGYSRKPNYHFSNQNDTGIDKVPENRIIVVEDVDGKVRHFAKIGNMGLDENSTVQDFILSENSKDIALNIDDEATSSDSLWSSNKIAPWTKIFVAVGGETIITIPDAKEYIIGTGELIIAIEGSIQILGIDYVESSTTTIEFDTALTEDEHIMFQKV